MNLNKAIFTQRFKKIRNILVYYIFPKNNIALSIFMRHCGLQAVDTFMIPLSVIRQYLASQ